MAFNGVSLDIGQIGGSEAPRNVYVQDDIFLGFDGSGAINIYEDYTSSSNYARFLGTWDSNKFTMKAETDGTNGTQGRIFFQANTANNVPVSVQGAASQSANLTEFQNSAGTVIASVDSDGDITSREFVANSGGDVTGVFRVNSESYLQIGAKSNSNLSILANDSERMRVSSSLIYLTTAIPFSDSYTLGRDANRFSTIYADQLDQEIALVGLELAPARYKRRVEQLPSKRRVGHHELLA